MFVFFLPCIAYVCEHLLSTFVSNNNGCAFVSVSLCVFSNCALLMYVNICYRLLWTYNIGVHLSQ